MVQQKSKAVFAVVRPHFVQFCPVQSSSHDDKIEYDSVRDAYLQGLDLTILHIQDIDVKKSLEKPPRRFAAPLQRRGITPP
jgi:very-short-patch-repair endonuclease